CSWVEAPRYKQRERHRAYPPRGGWAREGRRSLNLSARRAIRAFFKLSQSFGQLVELELAFRKRDFELPHTFRGSTAAEGAVRQAILFRFQITRQPLLIFLQASDFRLRIHRVAIRNAQIELRG